MHFSKFIVAACLAVATSAVDIRLRHGQGCTGGYTEYKNVAPRTCAPMLETGLVRAVGFRNLPIGSEMRGWQVDRKVRDSLCGFKAHSGKNRKRNDCLEFPHASGAFSAGSYGAAKKRRGAEDKDDSECTGVAKPHALVLDDGKKYDVRDMDEALLGSLHALAANGTLEADIPHLFKRFEVREYEDMSESEGDDK